MRKRLDIPSHWGRYGLSSWHEPAGWRGRDVLGTWYATCDISNISTHVVTYDQVSLSVKNLREGSMIRVVCRALRLEWNVVPKEPRTSQHTPFPHVRLDNLAYPNYIHHPSHFPPTTFPNSHVVTTTFLPTTSPPPQLLLQILANMAAANPSIQLDPKYDDYDFPTTAPEGRPGHPGHTTPEQDAQVHQLRMKLESQGYTERLDTLTLVCKQRLCGVRDGD